jgi:hypothetical protein
MRFNRVGYEGAQPGRRDGVQLDRFLVRSPVLGVRHQVAYRRDLWAESDEYVECWCEKEALAGVLYDVTYDYDVPLMVSRGFASESYLYSAAAAIDAKVYTGGQAAVRQTTIYYLGDHDPSGLKIDKSIETSIRRLLRDEFNWPDETGNADQLLTFERIAVTPAQIADWDLPTRPTKLKGNTFDECREPGVRARLAHPARTVGDPVVGDHSLTAHL